MRYMDTRCNVTREGNFYQVTGKDIFTGREVTIMVPAAEMFQYRQGKYIDQAMVSLNADEREFLISGMYESFPFGEEEDC